MEYLPGRPVERQRLGEGVFRPETGELFADHPAMERARERILKLGGVTRSNTFTKLYLCFFGQYDYDACRPFRRRSSCFPTGSGSISTKISSWSRRHPGAAIHLLRKKPFKKLPDQMGIEELFVGGRDKSRMHLQWSRKRISWRNILPAGDRMVHAFERVHIRPCVPSR